MHDWMTPVRVLAPFLLFLTSGCDAFARSNPLFDDEDEPADESDDGGGTTNLIITSFEDAYVDSDAPDANFGGATELFIDAAPVTYEAYIMPIGLDAIPTGATIQMAILRLYVNNDGSKVDVHEIVQSWSESAVTFNDRPAAGTTPFMSFSPGDVWVDLDVAPVVQAWVDGTPSYGFRLRSDGTDGSDFASSENQADRPELHIRFAL